MQYLVELLGSHAIMFKESIRKMPLIQIQVIKLPFALSIQIKRMYPHFSCHHLHLQYHKKYVQT